MFYLDFIFIPIDYIRTTKFRVFIFEWIVPSIISLLIYLSLYKGAVKYNFEEYINKVISLESILVGFSITSITFLTTASNRNVELLNTIKTRYRIGKKELSLMDIALINFSFSLFIEIFILIINLTAPILLIGFDLKFSHKIILFSINILLVMHNLFLNLRNLADLYLALLKNNK